MKSFGDQIGKICVVLLILTCLDSRHMMDEWLLKWNILSCEAASERTISTRESSHTSSGVDTPLDGVFDDTKADLNIRVRKSSYPSGGRQGCRLHRGSAFLRNIMGSRSSLFRGSAGLSSPPFYASRAQEETAISGPLIKNERWWSGLRSNTK